MAKFRILIADDDDDDFDLLSRIFNESSMQHQIERVQNGRELLQKLQQLSESGEPHPDLVLLDINMPKMNGIEALSKIRALLAYHDMPIIVHTTSGSTEHMRHCKMLGANGFVTKSSSLKSLVKFVEKINDSLLTSLDFVANETPAGGRQFFTL